jgi:peptide/nickel transport system substrate-binding protein
MRLTIWPLLVLLSLPPLGAASRPSYGGTIRIQIRAAPAAITDSKPLSSLVLEPLLGAGDNGEPVPVLAASWKRSPEGKRWELRLRPGVKLHDGSTLTAALAAQSLADDGLSAFARGEEVVVEAGFVEIVRTPVHGRGAPPAGTGSFRVTDWQSGVHATLAAFDEFREGRPFVDTIEVLMGRPLRDQLVDLELGKADLVEAGPAEVRRAAQRGLRTWSSAPVELIALEWEKPVNARLREAVALSIDRAAMMTVLLQRQGEIAGSLLPQWVSGYAFLFPPVTDVARAQQAASTLPANTKQVVMSYDPGDSVARLIAERVAVNARDAGVVIRTAPLAPNAELRLARISIDALDPARTLAALGAPNQGLYESERTLLGKFSVIPLFHLPHSYAFSARVRGWRPSPPGDWRLDTIWMEAAKP